MAVSSGESRVECSARSEAGCELGKGGLDEDESVIQGVQVAVEGEISVRGEKPVFRNSG